MNWVGSRSWPSCNAECTAEQRLYRCNAWKEERHTTPNVARFCETKAKSANSEWKWQRWLVSYTKIRMKLETFANFGSRSASLIFCVSVREASNLWESTWQFMVHWKEYQDGTRFVVGRWCWVWLRQTRRAVINYLWHILVRFLEVQRFFFKMGRLMCFHYDAIRIDLSIHYSYGQSRHYWWVVDERKMMHKTTSKRRGSVEKRLGVVDRVCRNTLGSGCESCEDASEKRKEGHSGGSNICTYKTDELAN